MKRISIALTFVLMVMTAGCGGGSVSSGKTLVDINGKKITEGDLDFLATLNPNIAAQLSTPFGKKQILDNLVEQDLLYQAARKEGLDQDPKVQAKIDLYKKVILAQAFVEENSVKEAQKYYNDHKNEFDQLKLSQILIRFATPQELKASKKTKSSAVSKHSEQEALALANQVYDKLKNGGDFAALAKTYSEDPMGKDQGGSLGFISKDDPKMSRRGFTPLVEKAFTMKVGEVAGPIKTASGYSVITVTAPAEQAPFEEVKNQILFKMRGDMRTTLLSTLKEKNKVVYAKEFETAPMQMPPQAVPSAPAQPGKR
ncbi:MAG: peptidylprolyl isomerase [Deltaproteobacteria bacterium]|nr:peptidylprolyl isomerase [Deltaproteobacteria bacterium]